MVTLIETATRLIVTGPEKELARLRQCFRYHPKNYFRIDAYQLWKMSGGERGWDGYRYPLLLKTRTAGEILRGRKDELIGFCQQYGYAVDGAKLLESPFKDLTVADVPDDLIQAGFKLDEHQKEAVVEWLRHGMGMAHMSVNSGKTATFAAAAEMIKRQFPDARCLYFTFTERLVNQVYAAMTEFLPGWNITQYGAGKRDSTGTDMVVATQAMLNRNYPALLEAKFFQTFMGLLLDECVTGDTLVTLDNGAEIPIRDINKPVLVQSFNEATGKIESNVAVNAKIGLRATWLISTVNEDIRCTGEHLFFTQRGWVEAKSLTSNDFVLYANSPTRTTSVRKFTWGCFNDHRGKVSSPETQHSPQYEAAKSSFSQVRAVKAFGWNSTKRAAKWWLGRAYMCFSYVKQCVIRRGLCHLLSKWKKDSFGALAFESWRKRLGLVVHGRWKQKQIGWYQSINRKFHERTKRDSARLAFSQMGHYTCGNESETQPLVSTLYESERSCLLCVGQSVHTPGNALQSVRSAAFCLSFLRQEIHSPKRHTVLLRGTSGIKSKTVPERLLRQAQNHNFRPNAPDNVGALEMENLLRLPSPIPDSASASNTLFNARVRQSNARILEFVRVCSTTPTGRVEEVFDLAVATNHNYFANRILIHNCHHIQSPTAERVLLASSAYFRLGASDSTKEADPDKWFKIMGLAGPIRCEVGSAELIESGRSAAPTLYLVDVPGWKNKFRDVEHEAKPNTPAWTLIDDKWVRGTYLGPVPVRDEKGRIKTRTRSKLKGDKWVKEVLPITVANVHRMKIESKVWQVPARYTMLDRRREHAIIRFKERNDLIVAWADYFSSQGKPTLVVATRTTHVLILEAMLKQRLPPERVQTLYGEDTTARRNEVFEWLKATPDSVLVSPLVKEGVSINELRAGIIADPVADPELARQIIGRFMRKKEEENFCELVWFIDRQHPRYQANVLEIVGCLEHIEGFTFYWPVQGPETIESATLHHGSAPKERKRV